MRVRLAAALMAALIIPSALAQVASAGTFVAVKEAECLAGSHFTGWMVGGQYVDSDNGVLPGQYSMLARWQGSDILSKVVSYDLGLLTGFHTPYQRGPVPQNRGDWPGAQVHCTDAGMLINTWHIPHRPIVGGGYNTMWGYAWSAANQPHAFQRNGFPADLVLQANLALVTYLPWPKAGSNVNDITGQYCFFAYVRDTSQPRLHPIAIIASAYLSNWDAAYAMNGYVGYDYGEADTQSAAASFPAWFVPAQAGGGVWFASGPISNAYKSNPFITTIYSTGSNDAPMSAIIDADAPLVFWRAHITPTNLVNIVDAINASACAGPPNCPEKGYSSNPASYVLEYAGVIAELRFSDLTSGSYDKSPTVWIVGDAKKDQGALGVRVNGFSVYQYVQ